jgi:hypothetical protein
MSGWKKMIPPTAALALTGAILADHPRQAGTARRETRVNATAVGRAYAAQLIGSYADAWDAAASAVEGGMSVAESQQVLQDTWKQSRARAFRERVAPTFSRVLPEGGEPDGASERARVVELWREFARGLRSHR